MMQHLLRIAMVLMTLFSSTCNACSCARIETCELAKNANLLVRVRITGMVDQFDATTLNYTGYVLRTYKNIDLNIKKVWNQGQTVQFTSPRSSAACGLELRQGEDYIIDGQVSNAGDVLVSACSLTQPWKSASLELRMTIRSGGEKCVEEGTFGKERTLKSIQVSHMQQARRPRQFQFPSSILSASKPTLKPMLLPKPFTTQQPSPGVRPLRDPCVRVRCGSFQICQSMNGTASCRDTCAPGRCPAGYECHLAAIECIKNPCYPVAVCQSSSPLKNPQPHQQSIDFKPCNMICNVDDPFNESDTNHQQQQRICASNGNTFNSECDFHKAQCTDPSLRPMPQLSMCDANAAVRQQSLKPQCDQLCPTEYQPVCGSDGRSYPNECTFHKLNSCRQDADASVSQLRTRIIQQGLCECESSFDACPTSYDPVCGTDSKTYGNLCFLDGTSRCLSPGLQILHRGICTIKSRSKMRRYPVSNQPPTNAEAIASIDGFQSIAETSQTQSSMDIVKNDSSRACPIVCAGIYDPVCSSMGRTYVNECQFRMANCLLSGGSMTIVYNGTCDDVLPLPSFCPIKSCSDEFQPVCGSDGRTYGNPCLFLRQQCTTPSLRFVTKGKCPSQCDSVCPAIYDPICGSDGETYASPCQLKIATCMNPNANITIRRFGECKQGDLNSAVNSMPMELPRYDSSVPCPRCNDSEEGKPVCGSDGNVYPSACALLTEACNTNRRDLFIVDGGSDGLCRKGSRYGHSPSTP